MHRKITRMSGFGGVHVHVCVSRKVWVGCWGGAGRARGAALLAAGCAWTRRKPLTPLQQQAGMAPMPPPASSHAAAFAPTPVLPSPPRCGSLGWPLQRSTPRPLQPPRNLLASIAPPPTRRRAAADLVRALTERYPAEVARLFTGYIGKGGGGGQPWGGTHLFLLFLLLCGDGRGGVGGGDGQMVSRVRRSREEQGGGLCLCWHCMHTKTHAHACEPQ